MAKYWCPILGRFMREYASRDLSSTFGHDVVQQMHDLAEVDGEGRWPRQYTRTLELLRAWYCMDVIWGRLMGPNIFGSLPRTREALNVLVAAANESEKDSVVRHTELAFDVSGGRAAVSAQLDKKNIEKTRDRALLVIEAVEFFRPKLKNSESLERMGYYMAKALEIQRHTSDEYITHARNLANITEEHAIEWTP